MIRPPQDARPAGPFVSVLTAETRGAIAIVRVWGEAAIEVADHVFRPHRGASLAKTPAGRPRIGRVGAGLGDEVVAIVIDSEDRSLEAEIQCHGGPAAVALVVEAFKAAGASRRSAEAWITHRASTPLSAQAEADLSDTETLRSARILLDQVGGALDEALERLGDQIANDRSGAIEALSALIRSAEVGTRLVSGWRVALAGRPNVGKSRLLNAMAGFSRAIVSPTPGTTRDPVTVRTAIEGWPVELADTAGLRSTDDPIEAGGVSLARSRHGRADLVLVVLDRAEPMTEADRSVIADHPDALIVCNKSDLPAAWEPPPAWGAVVVVSAERGDGLDALLAAIAARLVPDPPPTGSAVPFRVAQVRLLNRALRLVIGGRGEAAARAVGRLRCLGG